MARSRYHLRRDTARQVAEQLRDVFGEDAEKLVPQGAPLEAAEGEWESRLVLVAGAPLILTWEGGYFPTVRGAQLMGSQRRRVVVDMGAVPYVTNGAHVMGPGILEADPAIAPGELVVVVDQRHVKALAIGKALVAGAEMPGNKGRAVLNLHHVGDRLWNLEL